MERGALGGYVDRLRSSGYKDPDIAQYLRSQGYAEEQIRLALGRKNQKALILLFLLLVTVLVGGFFVLFFVVPSEPPLLVKIAASQQEIRAGQTLAFYQSVTPPSAQTKIVRTVRIVDDRGSPSEIPVTLSTGGGQVRTDKKTKPGTYVLYLDASLGESKTTQSFSFVVREVQERPAVVQDVVSLVQEEQEPQQPQTPLSGGATTLAADEEQFLCPLGCNDYNSCTEDLCDEGVCKYEPKPKPCCGDQMCDGDETSVTCAQDCAERAQLPTPREMIALALAAYQEDPQKAQELCAAIPKQNELDVCFHQLARNATNVELCKAIVDENTRDSCMMYFVLKHDEFSVCELFASPLMESTCYSMQRFKDAEKAARNAAEAQ